MKHGSLFSGIGGAELAAEWAGWENVFHCEINLFGRRVLDYYWPKATSYEDITKADFSIWRGRIDILTGGFPCQPFSLAGKRKGTEDDRNLWPRMFEVIQQIQPTWVVGENVYGLVNWDGGVVFDQVQADLESEGYQVQSVILPACAINAPHRRDRVWIVAHSNSGGRWRESGTREDDLRGSESKEQDNNTDEADKRHVEQRIITNSPSRTKGSSGESGEAKEIRCQDNDEQKSRGTSPELNNGCGSVLRDVTNPDSIRRNWESKWERQRTEINHSDSASTNWKNFPTQSPVCGRDDGLSARLDGITFPKWRNESIKAMGNAWVPGVAYEIFKVINEMNKIL